MIDIDHFKLFNDRYGHFVGDRVLQSVATALRRAVRRDDCVGRFGGEEFVVALPDVDQDQAVEIGERICEGVRKLLVPVGQDESVSVPGISVSVGVAVYPAAGAELDEVLLKADNAMFGAKDAGRDQVRATTFGSIPSNRFKPVRPRSRWVPDLPRAGLRPGDERAEGLEQTIPRSVSAHTKRSETECLPVRLVCERSRHAVAGPEFGRGLSWSRYVVGHGLDCVSTSLMAD